MLVPTNNVGKTPHRVSPPRPGEAPSSRLFNLSDHFKQSGNSQRQFVPGTTRVIRIYEQRGNQLRHERRVDWEMQRPAGFAKLVASAVSGTLGEIQKAITIPHRLHVVVKDLDKGAVTPELISATYKQFPNATWSVSSKVWKPDWLAEVPSAQVQLLLVPQLAAWQAVTHDASGVSCWITASGEVSYDAIREISTLSQHYPNAAIVVLPNAVSYIAYSRENDRGWYLPPDYNPPLFDCLPMASVFYPVLVAQRVHDNTPLEQAVHRAYSFTRQWMRIESGRLQSDEWCPTDDQNFRVDDSPSSSTPSPHREIQWQDACKEWEAAFKLDRVCVVNKRKAGGISDTSDGEIASEFHLWRGMTEVNGYVACVRRKRKILQRLLDEGRNFKYSEATDRRHRSFVLIDTPGSGKSHLAKSLASQLDMRLLEFNVTQMLDKRDLIQCFDVIITSQSQDPGAAWMVFIDEINGQLEGSHVYDSFLAPLQEGVYVRSSNKFQISPCFWLFAGTERPCRGDHEQDIATKALDFESRLTLPPLDMNFDPADTKEATQATIENIYVGVAALLAVFPDVRRVTTEVLQAFSLLPNDIGPREVVNFVRSFKYIQYGQVASHNLPQMWWRRFESRTSQIHRRWQKVLRNEDDAVIEIRTSPNLFNGEL
ncbi:MAG: AAA family ATPase [Candidatus Andersenbacteria bacterium]|nr:AAA family ATPase [Candidatus Andersenbacteria bacterium]